MYASIDMMSWLQYRREERDMLLGWQTLFYAGFQELALQLDTVNSPVRPI